MANFQNQPWKTLDILALTITILGWGGNFLAIRYAVLGIPSWTALSLRLALVSCVLIFFIRSPLAHLKYYLLISIVLVPGHFGLLFLASELTNNVSAVSLFIQLNPVFALLFAWLLLKEKPGIRRVFGLMLALCAMVILFYEPNLLGVSSALVIAALSAMFMGLYTVLLRSMPKQIRPIDIIGWTAIFGTLVISIIAYFVDGSPVVTLQNATLNNYLGIIYSVVVGSIVGHSCWAWLCQRHPVAQVVPFSLLVPIVAITLSAILLDEQISGQMMLSAAILCTGLFIIAKARR